VQPYQHHTANIANSFSLTLLINLSYELNPFYINIQSNHNTKHNFLAFVQSHGHLRPSNFFIMDNASIHFAAATRHILLQLFEIYEIHYIFLPTYSPELNPCELVFAYVKHFICTHHTADRQVHLVLLDALSCLPYATLLRFYHHCVHIRDRITNKSFHTQINLSATVYCRNCCVLLAHSVSPPPP
jgi:transposase